MNANATEGVLGKAMDFLSTTFKAEKGSFKKGVETYANKAEQKSVDGFKGGIEKIVKKGDKNASEAIVNKNIGFANEQAENLAERMGGKQTDNVKNIAQENVARKTLLSGSTKIDGEEAFKAAAGKEERRIGRGGLKESAKSYFTDPYKTMRDSGATDEARKLATRQFVGRSGAAAAGVGAVGAMGYNTLTTGDDAQGHGRTFGGAVGNTLGATAGVGALGTAGAFGASILKKL